MQKIQIGITNIKFLNFKTQDSSLSLADKWKVSEEIKDKEIPKILVPSFGTITPIFMAHL